MPAAKLPLYDTEESKDGSIPVLEQPPAIEHIRINAETPQN